jgi:hypothetical protein
MNKFGNSNCVERIEIMEKYRSLFGFKSVDYLVADREFIEKMREANLDTSLILFSMWTESIKEFAEKGQGNVIFLDGSTQGMQKSIQQMMAMNSMANS